MNFQWIKEGYNKIRFIGKQVNKVVIIGISYWEVDREEIDTIMNHINKDAKIYFVNPNPNVDFLKKLEQKFNNIEICKDYIPELI